MRLAPFIPQRPELPPHVAITSAGLVNLAEAQRLASAYSCGLAEALGELEARGADW